jgi:hypothetical protein
MAVKQNGVTVLDDAGNLLRDRVSGVPPHIETVTFNVTNCGSVLQVSRSRTGNSITFNLTLAAANCNCNCNCNCNG